MHWCIETKRMPVKIPAEKRSLIDFFCLILLGLPVNAAVTFRYHSARNDGILKRV